LEQLGAGAMGVVYRAHDEKLDRDVAIKVLRRGLLEDDVARRRIRREARAISRLSHPNIAAIFDFDTSEGVDFLVMELVPGISLDARLGRDPLTSEAVVDLGIELAAGLAAAHDRGIVHRDLKPGNIRLLPDQRVKIVDFGLAAFVRMEGVSATTETVSEAMGAVGTLPYMAPEQLRAEAPDHRSDLYSLGVVLFEMATGARPFQGPSAGALAGEILYRPAPLPRTLRPSIGAGLEAVILRALEKDADARYQSAKALESDLRRVRAGIWGPAPKVRPRLPLRNLVGIAGGAVLIASTLIVGLNVGGARDRIFHANQGIRSLAVLPFVNLSGRADQEYLVDGFTEELITELSKLRGLERVIARGSVMRFKGSDRSPRDAARALGVNAVVTGSVVRFGNRIRVTVQVYDARTERALWADRYEGDFGDLFSLQNAMVESVAREIRLDLSAQEKRRLASTRSVNPAAMEKYLEGKFHFNRYGEAVQYFQEALRLDPNFALAWSGLADAYCLASSLVLPPSEAMPRARAAASRALAIDSTLANAHASMAFVNAFYDWKWDEGEAGFRRAIELNPNEPVARQNYGYLLTVTRRFKEAEAELSRARQIDPLSPMIQVMALWPIYESGRYDQAIDEATKLLEADPSAGMANLTIGQASVMKGDYVRGIAALKELAKGRSNPLLIAWLGYAYATSGNRPAALALVDSLKVRADEGEWVQPYAFAILYVGLHDTGQALTWLERAVDLRTDEALFVNVDPAMEPLRKEPRFTALVERLGLAKSR
jgi:serine/threonine-protein kinase